MNQVLVYLSVNTGLLAMLACLWALNREPKALTHDLFTTHDASRIG